MAFQGHYITKELLKDEEENVEAIDERIRNESRWFRSFPRSTANQILLVSRMQAGRKLSLERMWCACWHGPNSLKKAPFQATCIFHIEQQR